MPESIDACKMLLISLLICLTKGEPSIVKATIGESITIPCEGIEKEARVDVQVYYEIIKDGHYKLGYCFEPFPVRKVECGTFNMQQNNMEWESKLINNQTWEVYFRIAKLELQSAGKYACTKTIYDKKREGIQSGENHTIIDVKPDVTISMTVNNHVFEIDDSTQQCVTIPSNITCSAQNYPHVHARIYYNHKRLDLDRLLMVNSSLNPDAEFCVSCCLETEDCSNFVFRTCLNTYDMLAFKPLRRYRVRDTSHAETILTATLDMPCLASPISNNIVTAFKRTRQEMIILRSLRIFNSLLSFLCLILTSITIAAGIAKCRSRQQPVNLWIAQPINSEISDEEQDPYDNLPGGRCELSGRASINKGFRLREWQRADFYGEREGM